MSQMEIDELGNKSWRNLLGQYHRDDGPALEYDGAKAGYINGKCHRLDGPAVEYKGRAMEWRINGQLFSFEDWLDQLQISNEEKVLLCLKWK